MDLRTVTEEVLAAQSHARNGDDSWAMANTGKMLMNSNLSKARRQRSNTAR